MLQIHCQQYQINTFSVYMPVFFKIRSFVLEIKTDVECDFEGPLNISLWLCLYCKVMFKQHDLLSHDIVTQDLVKCTKLGKTLLTLKQGQYLSYIKHPMRCEIFTYLNYYNILSMFIECTICKIWLVVNLTFKYRLCNVTCVEKAATFTYAIRKEDK